MPIDEIFLGRQPILDRQQRLVAYELLFRSGPRNRSSVTDDSLATTSVIGHAFGQIGAGTVLGAHQGFINFNEEMLQSDLIDLLPSSQVVIELLETVSITDQVISRCVELKARGFSIALDDFVFDESYLPLLAVADIVKIDLKLHDAARLEAAVRMLRRFPVKLLAEKVDSEEQARYCMELGFDLFQGYYFARPSVMRSRRQDASTVPMMRLLELILRDAETHEIEDVFKHSPELTYKLLRLVNSAACTVGREIGSVSQAVMMLGRIQLQRWLQLLLFTGHGDTTYPSPLMELAASRARLMENLAERAAPGNRALKDKAFMTGLLSLLDVLLGVSREEVVGQLGLAEDVSRGLLGEDGELGRLLQIAKMVEDDDRQGAVELLAQFDNLGLNDLTRAHLEALAWVNGLAAPTERVVS